mgnify:FL=1
MEYQRNGDGQMILFIYGASGAAVEIYDLAERINVLSHRYSKIYLIDDFEEETQYYGTDRVHFSSCERIAKEEFEFVIAVGEPAARAFLLKRIEESGYKLATLVDPSVIVSPTAKIAPGCIVNAQSIVSANAIMEENCLLGFHVVVGHDAHLKKNTVVCPMATVGGGSIVGENTFIGLNSSMKERTNLGDNVIVGMGSMVFRSVEDGCTVLGNPARVTKGNDEHRVFRD